MAMTWKPQDGYHTRADVEGYTVSAMRSRDSVQYVAWYYRRRIGPFRATAKAARADAEAHHQKNTSRAAA